MPVDDTCDTTQCCLQTVCVVTASLCVANIRTSINVNVTFY